MTSETCDVLDVRIDPKLTVDDVMRRWPATVGVFIRHRMKCVGSPFGTFHSVEHACDEHGTDLAEFVAALERALAVTA